METKNKMDALLKDLGLSMVVDSLNEYLGANFPRDKHRNILAFLSDRFPEFVFETTVFRAVRSKTIPKELRNKFVSGCSTKEDVLRFVEKRFDKGYKYILISKEKIKAFNLNKFILFMNQNYGEYITEFYLDENEVVFKLDKKLTFEIEKIS